MPPPCSATDSSMEALKQATIRTVAIIAEGVPERDTKELVAFARKHNKVIIGPATVGGVQVGRGLQRVGRGVQQSPPSGTSR